MEVFLTENLNRPPMKSDADYWEGFIPVLISSLMKYQNASKKRKNVAKYRFMICNKILQLGKKISFVEAVQIVANQHKIDINQIRHWLACCEGQLDVEILSHLLPPPVVDGERTNRAGFILIEKSINRGARRTDHRFKIGGGK